MEQILIMLVNADFIMVIKAVVFIIRLLASSISMIPRKAQQQMEYIQQYVFDSSIVQKLKNKKPNLTDIEIDRVFEGLRDYFIFCNQANGQMHSMPSHVVDDAWHEFI
ncbi:MAG: hypothetical protein ACRESZ_20250 [Methylococcales bacterium]